MVELIDAVGQYQRLMIGERGNARAEADVLRALGKRGDEEFWTRDQLVTGRMMLADPCFVVTEPVHPLDEFDVALNRQRRVFVDRVKGAMKAPKRIFVPTISGSFS